MRLKSTICILAGFTLAVALALWPRPAPAQGDADSVAPAVVSLCKEALAHAKRGEFEAARVLYARALETSPSAAILFNLALAELNAGHPLDALRHFREYTHARDAAPAKLAIIRADLLPKALAATGRIQINGAPSNATLYLDGEEIVSAPGGIVDVMPGPHSITARTPGQGWRADVTTTAGTTEDAAFKLVWVRAGGPQPPAVDAGSRPPATGDASVDGGSRR